MLWVGESGIIPVIFLLCLINTALNEVIIGYAVTTILLQTGIKQTSCLLLGLKEKMFRLKGLQVSKNGCGMHFPFFQGFFLVCVKYSHFKPCLNL